MGKEPKSGHEQASYGCTEIQAETAWIRSQAFGWKEVNDFKGCADNRTRILGGTNFRRGGDVKFSWIKTWSSNDALKEAYFCQ